MVAMDTGNFWHLKLINKILMKTSFYEAFEFFSFLDRCEDAG